MRLALLLLLLLLGLDTPARGDTSPPVTGTDWAPACKIDFVRARDELAQVIPLLASATVTNDATGVHLYVFATGDSGWYAADASRGEQPIDLRTAFDRPWFDVGVDDKPPHPLPQLHRWRHLGGRTGIVHANSVPPAAAARFRAVFEEVIDRCLMRALPVPRHLRLDGTVRAVRPGSPSDDAVPIEPDARFVLDLALHEIFGPDGPGGEGEEHLAVHSPSRRFGDAIVGRRFALTLLGTVSGRRIIWRCTRVEPLKPYPPRPSGGIMVP